MNEPAAQALLARDAEARAAALDTSRSLLVQAPAGSGKTTVLVCRYLALLAEAETPGELLAITFTRKAAAEMRARVLRALAVAARGQGSERVEAPLAERAWRQASDRGWQLLQNPGALRILTLDALNLELVGSAPLQSGHGLALRIAADPQRSYQAAARTALAGALQVPDLAPDVARLLTRMDNRWLLLEALIADMLARRAHWLPHLLGPDDRALAARVQDSLRRVIDSELLAAGSALGAELAADGLRLAQHAADTRGDPAVPPGAFDAALRALRAAPQGDDGRLEERTLQLAAWRAVARLALKQDGAARRQLDKRDGFGTDQPQVKARALSWLQALGERMPALASLRTVAHLPDARLDQPLLDALASMWRLLRHAAQELGYQQALAGETDFPSLAAAARASLVEGGEPTDLAMRFGQRLRHILVDEFQDTSLEQIELLRALSADWQPGDGRTLFAVGDAMQSIYRFRDAEVGLFLDARRRGVGTQALSSLSLSRNFRSGPALVDWVNTRVGGLFPPADDSLRAAVGFLPAVSSRPDLAAAVALRIYPGRDDATEARDVVDAIGEARRRDPSCSVAILVQGREHAAQIVPALQSAGYSVRGVKLEPLTGRPAVRDVVSLARALAHAADRPAWLALLRSPLCGLGRPELERLALAAVGATSLWEVMATRPAMIELDAAAGRQVERLVEAMRPAIEGEESVLSLAARVERCWLRVGGAAVHAGERDRAEVEALLCQLEVHAPIDLAGMALQTLLDTTRSNPPAADGAIEVLTIHAAKGLEWQVVLLPGLGRGPQAGARPLLHWCELPLGKDSALLMAPRAAPGEGAGKGSLSAFLRYIDGERARSERLRLLYVAVTRACESLHLFAHVESGSSGAARPAARSLLAELWPSVGEGFGAPGEPAHGASGAAAGGEEPIPSLRPDWDRAVGLTDPAWPRHRLSAPGAEEPEYRWVGQAARAAGTIIHAQLQRLADLPELPTAGSRWSGGVDYLGWLRDLGTAPEECDAAVERIHEAIGRTLADERARWLLDSRHQAAACELALSGRYASELIDIVIDRTFIDAAGTRWVVDYKSGTHQGSDLRAFLDGEVERYRPQLLRYQALASRLGPEPVRVAIFFPLYGEWREL